MTQSTILIKTIDNNEYLVDSISFSYNNKMNMTYLKGIDSEDDENIIHIPVVEILQITPTYMEPIHILSLN